MVFSKAFSLFVISLPALFLAGAVAGSNSSRHRSAPLEPCNYDGNCMEGLKCIRLGLSQNVDYCRGNSDCFCLPTRFRCTRSSQCAPNKACVRFRPPSNDTKNFCLPCSSLSGSIMYTEQVDTDERCPSPTPPNHETLGEDHNCIAAKHLMAARRQLEDLVFATHRIGSVLCDGSGSCATPSHIVAFQGRPMTMREYCSNSSQDGCVWREMLVNSPRYVRGDRTSSLTKGLEFTTFAAKYETDFEQHFLKIIVQMGF